MLSGMALPPSPLIAIGVVLTVGLVVLAVASSLAIQRRIVFFPEVLDEDAQLSFSRPHDEVWFDGGGGRRLHAVRFTPEGQRPGRGRAVLYLHGNAGSVRSWGEVGAELVASHQAVVYVVDYAGYGKSRGALTEGAILEDVVAVFDAIHRDHREVIVFGRSIGSGPAVWLASQRSPFLLILETPYASLVDLAGRLVPWWPQRLLAFRFDSEAWIRKVRCPVHILHGTDDEVIPLASARRLEPLLPAGSSFTIIPRGRHNDLSTFPEWHAAMARVLD
jgi:uncharacterized protein